MASIPLRLGSSTAGLSRSLSDDQRTSLWQSHSFSSEERTTFQDVAGDYAKLIEQSAIRSIEFFTTLPMLTLGLEHPWIELTRELGDHADIWSVHAPFGGVDPASPNEDTRLRSVRDIIKAARLAEALHAKVLTVHPGLELPDLEPRAVRLEASGRSIAEVADVCAALGIRVALEILPRNCIGNSLDELFAIAGIADRPNVGFCLDTNHSFPASALPDVVRALGSRLLTLHVSDHDDVDERHWLPMRGVIDWSAFIRSLREIGYTGPFLYEVPLIYPQFSEAISVLEDNYRQLMQAAQ